MGWICKICTYAAPETNELLRHYRLRHDHSEFLPCLHADCPCSFKTWNTLKSHLSRKHPTNKSTPEVICFSCELCSSSFSTEKDFFQHLAVHLRKNQTVHCVFRECDFSTNVFGTFASHRSRKHSAHSSNDFRAQIVHKYIDRSNSTDDIAEAHCSEAYECSRAHDCSGEYEPEELKEEEIELKLGHLLLKLESIYNVPSKCITEVVAELQVLSSVVSGPAIRKSVNSCLRKHNCVLDDLVVSDLVKQLSESNPISTALRSDGPLATTFKRREFFKKTFHVVEPVEYILDKKEGRTLQYVPILQSLSQILSLSDIQEKAFNSSYTSHEGRYESFHDGTHFKENPFLATENITLPLLLYIDDFEVCNPLGTSRKKHKITAVYWVLANIPPQFRATLKSIYLAVLCKATDVKKYGYEAVLEPLLKDLVQLEEEGLFIPALGKKIKGTIVSVVADNLGAHSIGGFVESFSGSHVCRFCLGALSEFQKKEVRAGSFRARTRQEHSLHVQTASENPTLTHCFGVKRQCPLTNKLQHFHVLSGYPPDLLHDLFEGIVPRELALCLNDLIKKKYFTLFQVNDLIRQFPYKWTDKTDSPQPVPLNFATRRSVGGNAHENWCLLRLLPLIIGFKVPESEPAWHLLMDLKDIVELVVSPVHTDETIRHLDIKIAEHRHRYLQVFPEAKLLPKHHFLEHYPQLIKAFGPLAALWTMRFEAKHSFFKRVVRHTSCFRNILLSLAVKHQFMLAYHFHGTDILKPALSVSNLSTVPVDVLKENIQEAVQRKFPGETCVQVTNTVTCYGTCYSVGMILPYGSTGGLPDFVELNLILVMRGQLAFAVKCLHSWYWEHLRAFELESTRQVTILEQQELTDSYPLAAYAFEQRRFVTLKRHIPIQD
ncbi:uncharacterized protein LOC130386152 isoform X1 [Gadus chalcogrammus]|uniref:uncharacterized protein LOC130386152 isoform X1 n=1 Tax=Gadus chalcogrammus TaxID=1042646 RepID=UPI0024C414F9|nr:uncharacterized protein LOC130386152 isoform X1 [Gadus chalcogrammus]